jgi:hypothetical protein
VPRNVAVISDHIERLANEFARRPMTAANGNFLLEPADCARATQRRIIAYRMILNQA